MHTSYTEGSRMDRVANMPSTFSLSRCGCGRGRGVEADGASGVSRQAAGTSWAHRMGDTQQLHANQAAAMAWHGMAWRYMQRTALTS